MQYIAFYVFLALLILASTARASDPSENGIWESPKPSATLRLIAERRVDPKRHCIPGPHDIGRTRTLIFRPLNPLKCCLPTTEFYPHCRYDSQEDADRAARRGDE
jgi:hypothetical protein